MTQSPPLDTARVDELAELFGDKGILLEIYDEFLKECPTRIQVMREGLAKKQADLVDSGAHAIKGSSANLGAQGILAMATHLEGLARANELGDAGQFLDQLESEVERLQAHLKDVGLG
ncbi:MAG: Hpt domain-containing protein [Planctomycetota bacterium]|nr:Hpt domain-containing protein [Planctomycetota bacterium]MDA1114604.1 Hpt domain-containing protein [Planctomycetota bacterium]